MNQENKLLLDSRTEKETTIKNNFELDESWLNDLDDLDDKLTDSKTINENLLITKQKKSKIENLDKIENTVNNFLNQLQNNQITDEKNEDTQTQDTSEEEILDDTPIVIVDYDETEENNQKNNIVEDDTMDNNESSNENQANKPETTEKKLSLDELIKKYEEKYQLHKLNQTNKDNSNKSFENKNIEEIKNNNTFSDEEKDNKLAERYVKNLSFQERKEMENFTTQQKPKAPKVVVPPSEPIEDDEFSHFKEIEKNINNAPSTANKPISPDKTCAKKISAFTKIAGFTKKYLFFLIALGVVIIGSSLYIFFTFFNK